MLALGEAVALPVAEADDWADDWPVFDWAVADWTRLALDVAALALPAGLELEVAVAVLPVAEPDVEPVSGWVAVDSAPALVLDSDPVGDGLADGQLAVPDGLAVAEPDVEPDGLVPAEDDPAGGELVGVEVWPGLGSLLGLVVGFGGRLDLGGRTCVTSLTTGSGLFGTAEAPSR